MLILALGLWCAKALTEISNQLHQMQLLQTTIKSKVELMENSMGKMVVNTSDLPFVAGIANSSYRNLKRLADRYSPDPEDD